MSGAAVWVSPDAARFEIRRGCAGAGVGRGRGDLGVRRRGGAGAAGWWWAVCCRPAGSIGIRWAGRRRTARAGARVPAEGASEAYEEIAAGGRARTAYRWRWVCRGRRSACGGWTGAVAAGRVVRGGAAGRWRRRCGRWPSSGSRLFAVDARTVWPYTVWVSADRWRDRGGRWRVPARWPVRPETAVAVAGGDGRVVLVTDDGGDGAYLLGGNRDLAVVSAEKVPASGRVRGGTFRAALRNGLACVAVTAYRANSPLSTLRHHEQYAGFAVRTRRRRQRTRGVASVRGAASCTWMKGHKP